MAEAAQVIKDLIKEYRAQENELYAQIEDILRRREELENVLEKIKKESKSQDANSKRPKGVLSKEIGTVLAEKMGNEKWRLTDLHKEVQNSLGQKVASSTLRSVLKSDNRFQKAAYGVYTLSQKEPK